MRQFPLEGLEIAPGRVVEWRLRSTRRSEEGGGPEGARKSASFNQDKHFSVVEEARKVNDSLASWLAVTFEVEGPLDRDALEAALLFLARRHEVLRCEFQRLAGDLSCGAIDADEIGLDVVEMGEFDTTAELRAFMSDSFQKQIDTLAWPLFMMGAVARETGSSTVYMAFDHIVSDGVSMPNVVNDIQTAYAAYKQGREPVLPVAGSYLDFAHEQRSRYLSLEADDERLDYWKSFMAGNGEFFPRFPLELGIEPGAMYPTMNEADRLLDARETEALETRCREAGGKFFMGLLASVGTALHTLGGPASYRGFMPVSERGRGPWTHSVGWFVNTLPIEFAVGKDQEFDELIAGVRAGFGAMMGSLEVPFIRAWELLAPEHFALRTWPYPVNFFSYMDMRRTPGAEHHPQWQPTAHVWASAANGTCSWFQRDVSGLHMNSIYVDTPEARRTMREVREVLTQTLLATSRAEALRREPAAVS
ncbi:condensation domain-containing protein [Streptomyces albireticuli]|uniref:condensation domain-containing protein n=1 Tax=Streptomyces albireticuli TaxID=1940 RepID=UPI0036C92C91